MPSKYLKISIGDFSVQVTDPEQLPLSINYALEDPDNFQDKKSAEAFGIKIPATLINDQSANTFRNADVADLTTDQVFRGNQQCVIESNGFEILNGKAFLTSATHNDKPIDYDYNIFGDNADWKVDLQEKTLFDFLSRINFIFTKSNIVNSWAFDGTDETLPYVFAPVKYRLPMGGYSIDSNGASVYVDDNMLPEYMKPALSKYWILFWAFKSVGYKIKSTFLDSPYFRRQVMPWTWGNFLDSDGTRLSVHNFLAKSIADVEYDSPLGSHSFIWDLNVSNDSTLGAFDNNNDYSYNTSTFEMTWQYKVPHYGILNATFGISISVDSTVADNSDCEMRVQWFKNGVMFDGGTGAYNVNGNEVYSISAPTIGVRTETGVHELFGTVQVNETDNSGAGTIITAKIYLHTFRSKAGRSNCTANVLEFKLDFFRIPLGGTIDFQNYTGLKKYKFMDYLRGLIDEFNWSINTDSINKVVVIEPTHQHSLNNNLGVKDKPGYFKNDFIDWNGKADLSKQWQMDNYSAYERELIFKYKDDNNDGILKVIQDRNVNILACGKYVLPERFKSGKRQVENRFFAATMHYELDQWKSITGVSPQMVAMIPENVSNTSNNEAANTFTPKSCFYKGNISGAGGWKFDGDVLTTFPFMFSVNYKDGGENDPILSYSDEKIKSGSGFIIGKGLLKRFYWQRLAIIRNGQWYNCWFRLKNIDVAGQLHQEYKSYNGQRWELIEIKNYQPLLEASTACLMRRWAPIELVDANNTYPAADTIINGTTPATNSLDLKYAPLKCLITDIPTT